MQDMPTGSYTRRLADNEFKPKSSIKLAIKWVEWVAYKERIYIRHQLNNTEKRIGGRKLPWTDFTLRLKPCITFKDASGMATIALLTEEKSITTNDRNRWLNYETKPEPTPSIFAAKATVSCIYMFTVRSSSYNLHGNNILALPNPKTTIYGLHSFSYLASKVWNSLPDTCKTLNFLEFKQEILRYEAFPQ